LEWVTDMFDKNFGHEFAEQIKEAKNVKITREDYRDGLKKYKAPVAVLYASLGPRW